MKICLVHNFYKQPGGEDSAVMNKMVLLKKKGHEVEIFKVRNNNIKGFWKKYETFILAPYNSVLKGNFLRFLQIKKPEIVHVHNFFPLLTPSVFDACKDAGVPVVMTLHNYRLICPGALLMRHGVVCKDCIEGSPYNAVVHRCYKNSILGSLAVARMISYHRKKRTWENKVDCFIALTEFAKSEFLKAGFPKDKIAVKPNFCDVNEVKPKQRQGALFVGRLSQEKGLTTMLAAWQKLDVPLRIAGDGPLMDVVKNNASPNITSLGQVSPDKVSEEMEKAAFLVFPSDCYEAFGLVIIEAFSHGMPVIASRLGSMAEIVEDGTTGLHFEPGNAEDLARKIQWLHDHPEEYERMGENARRVYEEKYTSERNYKMLMDIYQQAIEENKQKQSNRGRSF